MTSAVTFCSLYSSEPVSALKVSEASPTRNTRGHKGVSSDAGAAAKIDNVAPIPALP